MSLVSRFPLFRLSFSFSRLSRHVLHVPGRFRDADDSRSYTQRHLPPRLCQCFRFLFTRTRTTHSIATITLINGKVQHNSHSVCLIIAMQHLLATARRSLRVASGPAAGSFAVPVSATAGAPRCLSSSSALAIEHMGILRPSYGLWIDGQEVDAEAGQTMAIENPATGEILCNVAEGRDTDMVKAIESASRAFEDGRWSGMQPRDRGRILNKVRATATLKKPNSAQKFGKHPVLHPWFAKRSCQRLSVRRACGG